MSPSDPNEYKTRYLRASLSAKQEDAVTQAQEPAIVRYVSLPEKFSIEYLTEITGQALRTTIGDLVRLRSFLGRYRSLDFEDAAKLLRKYGIGANREV